MPKPSCTLGATRCPVTGSRSHRAGVEKTDMNRVLARRPFSDAGLLGRFGFAASRAARRDGRARVHLSRSRAAPLFVNRTQLAGGHRRLAHPR